MFVSDVIDPDIKLRLAMAFADKSGVKDIANMIKIKKGLNDWTNDQLKYTYYYRATHCKGPRWFVVTRETKQFYVGKMIKGTIDFAFSRVRYDATKFDTQVKETRMKKDGDEFRKFKRMTIGEITKGVDEFKMIVVNSGYARAWEV